MRTRLPTPTISNTAFPLARMNDAYAPLHSGQQAASTAYMTRNLNANQSTDLTDGIPYQPYSPHPAQPQHDDDKDDRRGPSVPMYRFRYGWKMDIH